MNEPIIVTLLLDPVAQDWFDGLRRQYFPPDRLVVGAHVTLLHALPATALPAILDRAEEIASGLDCFAVPVTGVRFLGRGAAFALHAPQAFDIRASLAALCRAELTSQDSNPGWSPHVTVQNKVTPEAARHTVAALSLLTPPPAMACGIGIWRYHGGPWEGVASLPFVGT